MSDHQMSSMDLDAMKSTQEYSEEMFSGLDNNAITSLYNQLGYVTVQYFVRIPCGAQFYAMRPCVVREEWQNSNQL